MSNQITVIGRVGGRPEFRTTPWGDLETTFRIATNERWRNKAGEWEAGHTSWFTVRTLRRLAEHVRDSVDKGQQLVVTGRVRVRPWESERGKGVAVEIDADHVGPDLVVASATVTPRPREDGPRPDDALGTSNGADSSAAATDGSSMSAPDAQAGRTPEWAVAPVGVGSEEPPF